MSPPLLGRLTAASLARLLIPAASALDIAAPVVVSAVPTATPLPAIPAPAAATVLAPAAPAAVVALALVISEALSAEAAPAVHTATAMAMIVAAARSDPTGRPRRPEGAVASRQPGLRAAQHPMRQRLRRRVGVAARGPVGAADAVGPDGRGVRHHAVH